jgi:hypothetical protein
MLFKVLFKRGFDATLMIDLLVGEEIALKLEKGEDYALCKITSIDQSADGRRCFIAVDLL